MAQAAESLTSSSGLLLFLLGGGLIGAAVSAYRFWVNYRTTERGMNRERIQQATRNERSAQHEAYLWQSRSADLTYLLKANGVTVPPLDPELQALVSPAVPENAVLDWNITDHGGRSG